MSVRVLTKVFSHSRSTLASRLVLLALADSAHDDGVTWIGQELLAGKALVSEQTVRRCLRDLEESGDIETRKAQRGRRRVNVYRVAMPGLIAVDYDRLPFELEDPFTAAHIARSSEADGRASTPPTTEDPGLDSAGASLLPLNRKGTQETPIAPPDDGRPENRPAMVARKPVTDAEYETAVQILGVFNLVAGTAYSSVDWVAKIISRLREHPSLTVEAHDVVIRRAFAGNHWWTGPPSPSIVYGNAAHFERCVHAVLVDPSGPGSGGLTAEQMEAQDG